MTRRTLFVALLAALLLVAPFRGQAAGETGGETAARNFIMQMADTGLAQLTADAIPEGERESRFRDIMHRYFAVDGIARWVVGRAAWQRASEAARSDFVEVFQDLLVESYAHRFADYRGEALAIDSAYSHANGDVLVRSRIVRPGATEALHVDWRVRPGTGGRHKVIDILVEGLSMAQKQRAEFDSFLRQHDRNLTVLIGELRRRIETVRAQRREAKG